MARVRRLGAQECEAMAEAAAGHLHAAHTAQVMTGDRIAIVVPAEGTPHEEAAEIQAHVLGLVMGALRSGIIPVMVNPALPPEAREQIIADAEVSLVIDDADSLFTLTSTRTDTPRIDLAPIPLGRPMHYTSGTTGRSKGVWSGIWDEQTATTAWADEQQQWVFTGQDVTLVHGPLAHSGPLRFAMLVLLAGGTVLLPGAFDAQRIADCLVEDRPTHAFVVPSHIQRLMALPGGPPPSPYRLLTHAGAACPAPLKQQIHDWAGVDRTWEFYGSTEGQFTACSGREWEQRPGTVGRARAGRTLTIRDGVIWCQVPRWFTFEYWNDPEKTLRAWHTNDQGGREFSVGDLGRLDEDGYLWLVGRRDDLIITGGVNVYPAQVEDVLLAHPSVSEVAVFGIEDEQWGQRVCAALVLHEDPAARSMETAATETVLRSITNHAAGHLAGYQRPKSYYPTSDLPRTESGKVRRTELPEFLGLG